MAHHRRPRLPSALAALSVGRRITLALAGLALLMVGLVSLLGHFMEHTTGLEAIQNAPWMACAREAARQLSTPGVRIVGPLDARWAASEDAVEMQGTAGGAGVTRMRFSCHAVLAGPGWVVERLLFAPR